MSELTDGRRRARKRLLSELLLESEWLMQRIPSSPGATPLFPTAAPFFGCAPLLYSDLNAVAAVNEEDSSKSRQLYKMAGPACILSTMQLTEKSSPALVQDEATRQRIRHHWASLCRTQSLFGDDIDRSIDFNPQNAVIIEGGGDAAAEGKALQWVHNPFTTLNPTTTILAGARFSPSATTTVRLLGDAAPLSPVVQPYPYFSRRNRRRACPSHSHLELPTASSLEPDVKAYRAAWDREEPLTLPPTCSCSAEALTSQYLQIVKRLVDLISSKIQPNSSSIPVSPAGGSSAVQNTDSTALLREADEFLAQQADCPVCGGLQYFPFSFIETPLTREASSLLDFCERVPLPPRTEVFCDGPKVTACIICRSPKHEWEVYKALYAVKEHTHAVIYDVCTCHYFPGYKPSKMYWSRNLVKSSPQVQSTTSVSLSPVEVKSPSATVNSPRSAAVETILPSIDDESMIEPESAVQKAWRSLIPIYQESPLRPPQQCPLNLSRCEPHSLYTPIPTYSLTTPDLRRVYCVSARTLPEDFDPSKYISAEDCEAIERAHRDRIQHESGMDLQNQINHLRRQNVLAEHKLTLLRQQAWGYRLSTPDFLASPSKLAKVLSVVPIRPASQSTRRDAPSQTERTISQREARRSPSDSRSAAPRDHRTHPGPQTQIPSKNRIPTGVNDRRPVGGGGETAGMPRYPPNAHSSAAASRIHALRAGTSNSQGPGDRR